MTKPKTAKNPLQTLADATAPGKTPAAAKSAPKAAAKKAPAKAPVAAPKAESPQYLKVQGTAKEIMEKGVWLNGKPVDSVALSVLAKFGTIKEVGKEIRPVGAMGRAGTIYEIQGKSGFKVEIMGAPAKAPIQSPVAQETQAQEAQPATPLEAMQKAHQPEGTAVQITLANPQRLPGGFDHARAMGLN